MKPFKIKLRKKGISKNAGYEIVVTRNVNRANPDVLEILGLYNGNYPVRFSFINMDRFSLCVIRVRLLTLQYYA